LQLKRADQFNEIDKLSQLHNLQRRERILLQEAMDKAEYAHRKGQEIDFIDRLS